VAAKATDAYQAVVAEIKAEQKFQEELAKDDEINKAARTAVQ